ncbi:hypothetical protein [Streptomyces sp. NPDC019224]|uniref:hypothetical protein n=1 Tax=Streptomyces sp. NPDC019224 TaxID=3154484 RepID=UPI00340B7714
MSKPSGQPSPRGDDNAIVTLDQRALPHERRLLRLDAVDDVITAITTLAVRGAPSIGLAGALGVALQAYAHCSPGITGDGQEAVRADAQRLAAARPTAVNPAWAVDRAPGSRPRARTRPLPHLHRPRHRIRRGVERGEGVSRDEVLWSSARTWSA